MALQLLKAQRSKSFLKLGMSGASGSGKTFGALLLAYGLMKELHPDMPDAELWEKIVIIDTENGSGQLYVGKESNGLTIGVYNTIGFSAPFTAEKYIEAVDICVANKLEVVIIDSVTHLWSGEGGLLEQQGDVAKRTKNSYTAWREITPMYNSFLERILQSPIHLIATMRAKTEHVQEKDSNTGKTVVTKVGLEPEIRKGFEFELTTFLELNAEHEAFGAKDRTSLFDQATFKIAPATGKAFMKWLQGGVSTAPVVVPTVKPANPVESLEKTKAEVIAKCKELGGLGNEELMKVLKKYTPKGNPNSIEDGVKMKELLNELNELPVNSVQESAPESAE